MKNGLHSSLQNQRTSADHEELFDFSLLLQDCRLSDAPPQQRIPEVTQVLNPSHPPDENRHKRPWMPKMEFPRFEGEGFRIWSRIFLLYQIPEVLKLMSASLHLHGNAAQWFQASPQFGAAILQKFYMNVHRTCMRDLLVLKQQGSVGYCSQFNQLVYQVRLYEGVVSETMLVTHFILDLEEEIRHAVELQCSGAKEEARLLLYL